MSQTEKKPSRLRIFFSPAANAPFHIWIAPYFVLGIAGVIAFLVTAAGWTYTNASPFCGTTCHTMPPQYNTYLRSAHSRVSCVECHIGRDNLAVIVGRKIEHTQTVYAMLFKTYEFPIVAEKMRPANEACETCHYPRSFTADSLREIRRHADDEANTPLSTFLLMRIGGGTRRDGFGRGIHWHVENDISFYATDDLEQEIPYVRVESADGTVKEYLDIDSGITAEQAAGQKLHKVDCITCHNRISHTINSPEQVVDTALNTGSIAADLPFVRKQAVALLRQPYAGQAEAFAAFAGLGAFYQANYPDLAASHAAAITRVEDFLKSSYTQTHFPEQALSWETHPDNTGHSQSPGCFRCHDGKHRSVEGEAIRLECNLCHSIPQAADPAQFVTTVSIVRGAEPGSHTSSLWIALHGKAIDATCARCHPSNDPDIDWTQLNGQKPPADSSFCGNSACHQSAWDYAAFDSPGLQPLLAQELEAIR